MSASSANFERLSSVMGTTLFDAQWCCGITPIRSALSGNPRDILGKENKIQLPITSCEIHDPTGP